MPRFFIEQTVDPGQVSLRIDGEDARHIRDVLRMRPGEKLIVCDGARTDLLTQITALDSGGVTLAIEERRPSQTESPLDIWLFQGLPKADKLETIIQHNQGANPPDFDYAFNLEYGRKYTQTEPLLAEIRAIVDADTRRHAEVSR